MFRLSDGLIALQEQAFSNGATAVMIQCYDEIFGDDDGGGEIKRSRKKRVDLGFPFVRRSRLIDSLLNALLSSASGRPVSVKKMRMQSLTHSTPWILEREGLETRVR